MWFIYIHMLWFGSWIGFGVESYPYGLLTMIVSLEAIFLSTFVLISQNRADAKRQVLANQQWQTVKEEDKQNDELLTLSNQILTLTKAIHESTTRRAEAVHLLIGRSETGPRQHAPQVDNHLLVDVLPVRRAEHLGLASEADLEVSVALFDDGPDGFEQ
jgi:uncharacterized membrane protein